MSKFIFSSPRKYVQGAGVLDELGTYVAELASMRFWSPMTSSGS